MLKFANIYLIERTVLDRDAVSGSAFAGFG